MLQLAEVKTPSVPVSTAQLWRHLRYAVVTALETEHTVIEAIKLWDDEYKPRILRSEPGDHRITIGAHVIEYTVKE